MELRTLYGGELQHAIRPIHLVILQESKLPRCLRAYWELGYRIVNKNRCEIR